MAAIDKMYLKDYYTFDEFRLWCIVNKPILLYHFYHWNMNEKEWNEWKEYCYKEHKAVLERTHAINKNVKTLEADYRRQYESIGEEFPGIPLEQLEEEVNQHKKYWKEIQNKKEWIENHTLPITNFSCEEDEYLLWHCPIKEVRDYLINQCGYKEKWYYRLFFKE